MEFYKSTTAQRAKYPPHIHRRHRRNCGDGVTEEQIKQVQNPLFREIAYFMFTNKYPREFRIADFRAWDKPEIKSTRKQNQHLLPHGQPHGIAVKTGQRANSTSRRHPRQAHCTPLLNLATPGEDGWHTGTERYPYSRHQQNNHHQTGPPIHRVPHA